MMRRLALLFGIALVVRVVAVLAIGEYERPNVWESGAIARALVEGRGFAFDWRAMLAPRAEPAEASTWWPPLYPLFLAGCHLLAPGAPYLLASLLQCVLSALVPLLLFAAARPLFGERAAWLAAAIATVHPPLIGFAALIQTAILEIVLTTAAIVLFLRAGEAKGRAWHATAGGAATALAGLTRPPALALLAIAPVAWRAAGLDARRTLARAALALLGAALLLGPWVARNHHVRGAWVLVSSNGGWNLYLGNNPAGTADKADVGRAVPPPLRDRLLRMNEVEGDRVLRALALEHIRTHPAQTAAIVARRALNLLWFNPEFGSSSGYARGVQRWTRPVYMTAWALLVAFAVAGMRVTRREARRHLLLYGAIAANAAVILATFFVNRYRAPIEPLLILFAAAALDRALDRVPARQRGGLRASESRGNAIRGGRSSAS